MKKLLLALSTCIALTATAEDLHIISAGSRTGSLTMQANAYAKDLGSNYQIKISAPGNFCEALSLINDKTPTLFLWGHDFEAETRAGQCADNKKLSNAIPIRFIKSPNLVCTMNREKNILKDSGTIGHTSPKKMFTNIVNNLNLAFNTNHKSVTYNGNGQVRLALVNGEVDFGIMTNEHAEFVRGKGGVCEYVLDDRTTLTDTKILQNLNPKIRLVHSLDNMFYTLNMSKSKSDSLVSIMKAAHKDCTSAIGAYTKCDTLLVGTWEINKSVLDRWDSDVRDIAAEMN